MEVATNATYLYSGHFVSELVLHTGHATKFKKFDRRVIPLPPSASAPFLTIPLQLMSLRLVISAGLKIYSKLYHLLSVTQDIDQDVRQVIDDAVKRAKSDKEIGLDDLMGADICVKPIDARIRDVTAFDTLSQNELARLSTPTILLCICFRE